MFSTNPQKKAELLKQAVPIYENTIKSLQEMHVIQRYLICSTDLRWTWEKPLTKDTVQFQTVEVNSSDVLRLKQHFYQMVKFLCVSSFNTFASTDDSVQN